MKNLHCLPKRIIIKHALAWGLGLGLDSGCRCGCGSLRSTSGSDQLYRRALILRLVLGAIRGLRGLRGLRALVPGPDY